MSEEELYEKGILSICQELHMHRTGAADHLASEVKTQMLNYLYKRTENWKAPFEPYDMCIRVLIHEVIYSDYGMLLNKETMVWNYE